MATPDWAKIASFYAGRPIAVDAPDRQPGGSPWGSKLGTTAQDGAVHLSPATLETLNSMTSLLPKRQASMYALQTLIHEALHNRQDAPSPPYKSWRDEWQAPAMAVSLIPDALQRFFGVKFGSPLSNFYYKQAQGSHSVGPPPAGWQYE